MYWIIPLILSVACAFINPNVGLIGGIFMSIQLLIVFCFGIIGYSVIRISLRDSGPENKPYTDKLNQIGEGLLLAWCIFAVFFFVLCTVVSVITWVLATSSLVANPNATLADTLRDNPITITITSEDYNSLFLLVVGVLLNLSAVILIFRYRIKVVKRGKESIRLAPETGQVGQIEQSMPVEQSPQYNQHGQPYAQYPQPNQHGQPYAQYPQPNQYGQPYVQNPQPNQYGQPYAQYSQPNQYGQPYAQYPQPNQYGQPYAQYPQYNQYNQPYAQYPQPNSPRVDVPERIFRVGVLPLVFLALSVIFGILDYKFGWLALPLNAFYLLFIGIVKILLFVYRKAAATRAPISPTYSNHPVFPIGRSAVKHNAHYILSEMGKGGSANNIIAAIVWLAPLTTIGVHTILNFLPAEPAFALFNFEIDYVFWILASICNILTAVFLTKAVREI